MADVAENASYTDAATAISQGKRHLLVQDYTAAVTAFAEGLEMMSQKLSDCDDELGEPYLLYGRALLGLAREEAGVLGGGVPGSEEAEEDEDVEEEDGEEEKMSDIDEKDEEADEKKESTAEKSDKKPEPDAKPEEKPETEKSNETDDKKIEEQKLQKSPEKVEKQAAEKTDEKTPEAEVESVAGSSKVQANGSASSAEKGCNGTAGKSDDPEDGEDVNKEEEDEDPGRGIDLQVAWEVLELAKIVFTKRADAGLKKLAETHRLLGEVAMESDNPQGAITDLEGALKLLQKIEPCEPRAIAELHYQLGLAHSMLNEFDVSIGEFKEATTLLEARIKQLEEIKEPPKSDDPFYSVEGEIKELKELLPAIQEKITDMKDFKEEACRLVIEGIKNKVAGGCTNGAGSSSNNDGASSSSQQDAVSPKNPKPASDISHLVRKKRKADESESPAQSPCKKPTP